MKYEDIHSVISVFLNKSLKLRKIPFINKYVGIMLDDNYPSELDWICTELADKISGMREDTQEDKRVVKGLLQELDAAIITSNMKEQKIKSLEEKLEKAIMKSVEYLEIIDKLTDIKKPG